MIMLAGAAFLVTFGCLYLRDRFTRIEAAAANVLQVSITEEAVQETVAEEEPVVTAPSAGMYVVLDAGHGGNDGGTYYKDVIEKDVNLAVTGYLEEILEENEVNVIMTRTTDDYLSLEERCYIANQTNADLFVSIHCNYFEDDASVDGIDCYYYPNSDEGEQFAETVVAAMEENNSLDVRGVKEEDFYVLENTDMTAILVEIGFLSNATDRKNLTNADYQQMLAEELAKGILATLEDTDAAKD